jgi:proline iminopeptidase
LLAGERQSAGRREDESIHDLYPVLEPYDCGQLDVGDGHSLYWEVCGDPEGKPALVLHGGPGSGCTPWHRRLFDPHRYRIVLYDQRNCGRSTPHASHPDVRLAENTTHYLVADVERLRSHLGVERWLLLGGSWGSTLALAYSEANPHRITELILFAVTAGLRREFDWVFRGGLATQFPAQWQRLRNAVLAESDHDVVEAVHQLLVDPDAGVRERAAYEWCLWESAIPEWPPSTILHPRFRDPVYALGFARIVTHYVRHYAWLQDGVLLDGTTALAGIRAILIDGRHDPQTAATAEELARRLPLAQHVIVENASHAATNLNIASELVRATDRFATA